MELREWNIKEYRRSEEGRQRERERKKDQGGEGEGWERNGKKVRDEEIYEHTPNGS